MFSFVFHDKLHFPPCTSQDLVVAKSEANNAKAIKETKCKWEWITERACQSLKERMHWKGKDGWWDKRRRNWKLKWGKNNEAGKEIEGRKGMDNRKWGKKKGSESGKWAGRKEGHWEKESWILLRRLPWGWRVERCDGGGGQGNSVDSYKLIMLSGSHWDGNTGLNASIKTVWTSQVSSTINPGVGRGHAERKGGREVREKKLEE